MTEDLKRCPFCKGNAWMSEQKTGHSVFCGGCGLKTRDYKTPEEAVAAWNNRPLEKENKRLKKKLDEALRQRDFNAGLALGFQDRVKQMRETLEHATTSETSFRQYGIWRIDGKTFQTWAADVLKGRIKDE